MIWLVVLSLSFNPSLLNGRTWKDASGKFEIDAQFVEVRGNIVRLKRDGDGSVLEIGLDRLSVADRQFIEGLKPPPSKSVDTILPLL